MLHQEQEAQGQQGRFTLTGSRRPLILAVAAILAGPLAAGTAELRASGELAKILAAYGMSDWKKQ